MSIVVIIVVVIVVLAIAVAAAMMMRRRRLQQQFGPEYDRAVAAGGSRLRAESELTERQRRVRQLSIRPLSEEARTRYAADWVAVQERFVDAPEAAVADGYELVTTVMRERGYPVEDDDQVLADLSVEHAETVSHLRSARQISQSAVAGNAGTEDLRQALIHYRALFGELLGDERADGQTAGAEAAPAETLPVGASEDPASAGTAAADPVAGEHAYVGSQPSGGPPTEPDGIAGTPVSDPSEAR